MLIMCLLKKATFTKISYEVMMKIAPKDTYSIKYFKKLHKLHNDMPFFAHKMKNIKCEKNLCNIYDNKKYSYI